MAGTMTEGGAAGAGIGERTRVAMPFTAGSHLGYCSELGQEAVLIMKIRFRCFFSRPTEGYEYKKNDW